MDIATLVNMLKYIGIGSGGAGVLMAVLLTTGFLKVKDHAKRVEKLEKRCNGQDETLVKQGNTLTKIETQTVALVEGQKTMFRKLDDITKLHLKD